MREEEAKKKWCPFVRHYLEGGSFNRGAGNAINDHSDNQGTLCNCIGSDCMAWRQKKHSVPSFDECDKKQLEPLEYEGYCGLAGKQ